ncbi:unnamed protein product [Ixodes pacificus]
MYETAVGEFGSCALLDGANPSANPNPCRSRRSADTALLERATMDPTFNVGRFTGPKFSHSHYQNNIVVEAAAVPSPCQGSHQGSVAMPTERRSSVGDGSSLDPVAGGASSSSDETSTDCKDSAYVSSERLTVMDTSPPWTASSPDFGPEVMFDRLTELAIIATSPESPLLRASPPLLGPPSARSLSLSALHSYARPPLPQLVRIDVSKVRFSRKPLFLNFVFFKSYVSGVFQEAASDSRRPLCRLHPQHHGSGGPTDRPLQSKCSGRFQRTRHFGMPYYQAPAPHERVHALRPEAPGRVLPPAPGQGQPGHQRDAGRPVAQDEVRGEEDVLPGGQGAGGRGEEGAPGLLEAQALLLHQPLSRPLLRPARRVQTPPPPGARPVPGPRLEGAAAVVGRPRARLPVPVLAADALTDCRISARRFVKEATLRRGEQIWQTRAAACLRLTFVSRLRFRLSLSK